MRTTRPGALNWGGVKIERTPLTNPSWGEEVHQVMGGGGIVQT